MTETYEVKEHSSHSADGGHREGEKEVGGGRKRGTKIFIKENMSDDEVIGRRWNEDDMQLILRKTIMGIRQQ